MTTKKLEEATGARDTPLQWIGKAPEEMGPGSTCSYYYQCHFKPIMVIGGRFVVHQYDPDEWPYPPEPDYQKDWDEAGE